MKKSIGWYAGRMLLRATRAKTPLGRGMARVARRYLDSFNDNTGDPNFNGEYRLVERLGALQPRVIFDVGANVGEWTAQALGQCPTARIQSFELNLATAQLLAARFANEPRVDVNAFGLSEAVGTIEYLEFENSELNSLMVEGSIHDLPSRRVSAQVRDGDSYCAESGIEFIDFLKIDTEGAERLVLAGFQAMLARRAIRLIQFEYGYANLSARFFISDFVAMLAPHGYRVAQLRSRGIVDTPYHVTWNNFETGPNYVAFREDDRELLAACAG